MSSSNIWQLMGPVYILAKLGGAWRWGGRFEMGEHSRLDYHLSLKTNSKWPALLLSCQNAKMRSLCLTTSIPSSFIILYLSQFFLLHSEGKSLKPQSH